jgi:hypothetical protein
MKAVIEFDLNDSIDIQAHKRFMSIDSVYYVLWKFTEEMRRQVKYNTNNYNGEQLEAIKKLRETFNELLINNQITLD